jgi:endogenous inhibitor of DNA gyrase (YacG/DUF329 family)
MKHRCPICSKPTDSATDADFPFCSERCRDKDLGNWASERYVVSEPVFDDDALEALLDDDTPGESDHSSHPDDPAEHDSN